MKTLTKEDKKYIQQIIWGATNPNRNQGYWDMLHEIKDAETSLNKTQRQRELIEYIDGIGGYDED